MATDDEKNLIKFEVKMDPYSGKMEINLMQFLQELDDETLDQLMSDGGYWPFISKHFIKDIINGFSNPGFNSKIFEIRQGILNSESIHTMIRTFLEGIVRDTAHQVATGKDYERAYWDLYNGIREIEVLDRSLEIFNVRVQHKPRPLSSYRWVNNFVNDFWKVFKEQNPHFLEDETEEL